MTGGELTLRHLREDDEAEAAAAHRELAAEGFVFLLFRDAVGSFDAYLHLLERQRLGRDLAPHLVPATFLVADVDGLIVGRVHLRHRLNERLRRDGGNIGFAVRPHARGHGHATAMLRAALEIASELGIDEALLTCDIHNLASRRTIERCGGRLEDVVDVAGGVNRRYWVPTRPRPSHGTELGG